MKVIDSNSSSSINTDFLPVPVKIFVIGAPNKPSSRMVPFGLF